MFNAAVNVKMFTLVLRKPRPWIFYGINVLELIVEPGPVLLVSGVSTSDGFQCVLDGGAEGAILRSCVGSIAEGGVENMFLSGPEGMLKTVTDPDQCLLISEGSGALVTGSCGKPGQSNPGAIFELTGASQLSAPQTGDRCVSVKGAVGAAAATHSATASASSAQPNHPAAAVLDGNPQSYWAADIGTEGVEFTLSLGVSPKRIESITIDFEYPAKSFQVDVAHAGPRRAVFATSANHLNSTHIVLGGVPGSSVRILLREPHPVWAVVDGRSVVGIRTISVVASSATLVLEPCTEAGRSRDAGDKFVMVSVPEHDPARAATARDLAALANKAGNRLAGLLAALAAERPRLDSCKLFGRRACVGGNCTSGPWPQALARYGGAPRALASDHISDSSRLDDLIRSARREIANVGWKV